MDFSDRSSWILIKTHFLGRCVLVLGSAYIGFVLHFLVHAGLVNQYETYLMPI